MSKMIVYKASAGSGKTFRLTLEYLKIVLKQPLHYKKILAITFTNKATTEMKSRILEQLHILARGQESNYLSILGKELNISAEEIRQEAQKAEQYILHDYSHFSVMTIDAFFQTILKAFAKELGVSYNYNVELDVERIRRLAVERMFEELDDNTNLRKWLRSYIQDKIQSDKSWNITHDILALSKELLQEDLFLMNKEQFTKWSDREFAQDFSKRLYALMQNYENKLAAYGKEAWQLIENAGLQVDDFTQKQKGIGAFFHNLTNGKVFTSITSSYHTRPLDNPEGWYSKTAKPDIKQKIDAIYPSLNEQLHKIFDFVEQEGAKYASYDLVRQNLYMMGIFSDIARHIYEILNEEEKILLSESNKLLYEMIAENEVPFIYEKTGNQYLYFLWDEFQDTSQMQWHNLKPLLANALSEGNPCLIVGDIKQAIYRWRNSDWRILGKEVGEAFSYVKTITMQQNWRSDTLIIDFNNMLFTELPKILERNLELKEANISTLYEGVQQEYSGSDKKEQGFIHFSYLEKSDEFTDTELILRELPRWVEQIQQNGVKPEDIVFLVRKNSEAVAIADYFTNLEERKEGIVYNVVSEYALLLENALVVKILINALYYLLTQENYYLVFLEKLMSYLENGKEKLEIWKQAPEMEAGSTSLEQLIQKAIRIFDLHNLGKEQLYLMTFEEFVNTATQNKVTLLNDFLQLWEDRKEQLSVSLSERIPAMQVMTIHKAKGLEFHTVILPFVDKNLEYIRQGETIWGKADFAPLNEVGALLLPFSKKNLLESTFSTIYSEEMVQRYIDELNVLYVATTRAISNLILIGVEKNQGTYFTTLLYDMISQAEKDSYWEKYRDTEKRQWSCGEITASKEKKQNTVTYEQKSCNYQDYLKKFPLSISSVDEAKRKNINDLTPIEDGKIWHYLLQNIYYTPDIPKAVKHAYYCGVITKNGAQNYVLHLQELLTRKTIAEYYTKKYKVWNERPIWIEGATYIPDRVVSNNDEIIIIEYKFGEAHSENHKAQVKKYIDFFAKQGYTNIKAFLIYGIYSEIISIT